MQQKYKKWLKIGLYVINQAQNLHAFMNFHFKAIGVKKRVDYRGVSIKNHQKTMPKWGVNGGVYPPYIPLLKGTPKAERLDPPADTEASLPEKAPILLRE